jgi:hypothetical protein
LCLPTLRSLKKEHELYQKEAVDQKLKKDKLIADGVDDSEWEVKNAVRSTATALLGRTYTG